MSATYLTVEEARTGYALTARQLKRLREKRLVRFARVGHRTILVHRESLEKFLGARTVRAVGAGGGS